jgi:hypothetical protein
MVLDLLIPMRPMVGYGRDDAVLLRRERPGWVLRELVKHDGVVEILVFVVEGPVFVGRLHLRLRLRELDRIVL